MAKRLILSKALPDDPIYSAGFVTGGIPVAGPGGIDDKQHKRAEMKYIHNFIVIGCPLNTCCLKSLDDDHLYK